MSQLLHAIRHALHSRGDTPPAPARNVPIARIGWPPLSVPSGSHRRSSDEQPWFREGPEDPWRRDQPPAAKPWS
ncbi:hypothetical protein [Cognatilysobacter segetis]|uniref:hypothetical protein n=2 Tax=Cognatilysobacter segetis TaxID=2492394 RepID=UPI00105BAECE|nr:hypothetical protein [Lysobacter segetis]